MIAHIQYGAIGLTIDDTKYTCFITYNDKEILSRNFIEQPTSNFFVLVAVPLPTILQIQFSGLSVHDGLRGEEFISEQRECK